LGARKSGWRGTGVKLGTDKWFRSWLIPGLMLLAAWVIIGAFRFTIYMHIKKSEVRGKMSLVLWCEDEDELFDEIWMEDCAL
jgi:hypothetical protein